MSNTERYAKPYDIRWPLTPQTLEDLNAALDDIYRLLRQYSAAINSKKDSADIPNVWPETRGGTGESGYAEGDLLAGDDQGGLSKLAAGDEDDVLTMKSGVPSWEVPTAGGGSVESVTGTTDQVNVDNTDPANPVLSAPQDIATDSDVQHGSLGLGVAPEAGSVFKALGHGYFGQYDAGSSGAAKTIDWQNGNPQILLLTADCTLTFSNPKAGAHYVLRLLQNAGAPFAVTWPGNVVWSGDLEPTLSQVAGGKDLIAFYYDGTDYIGAGANASALSQGLPENPLAVLHGGTGLFSIAKGQLLAGNASGGFSKVAAPANDGDVLVGDASADGGVAFATSVMATAHVYLSSDTTADVNVEKLIEWDAEVADTFGMHSNVTNPSRLTIPSGHGGTYLVTVGIGWASLVGSVATRLYKNGTLVGQDLSVGSNVVAPYTSPLMRSFQVALVPTDYIEIKVEYVYNTGASSPAIDGGTASTFVHATQLT